VAVRHWHKLSRSTKGTQSQKSDYNLFQDLPNVDRLTSQVAFHVYIESFVFPVSKDTLQFIYLYEDLPNVDGLGNQFASRFTMRND